MLIRKHTIMGQIKSILLVFTLLMTTATYAQYSPLQGPKAKNLKPWENKGLKQGVYTRSTRSSLQSPKAKNQRVWDKRESDLLEVSSNKSRKLKAYNEKNRKPWAVN